MASVLSAAFGPDSLFKYLFPYQDRFPQDMEGALREGLWLSFYDVKKVLMVSYEASKAGEVDERQPLVRKGIGKGEGRITGMAEWERGVNGKGAGHVNGFWGWWDPRKFEPLASTQSLLLLQPNTGLPITNPRPSNETPPLNLLPPPPPLHHQPRRPRPINTLPPDIL